MIDDRASGDRTIADRELAAAVSAVLAASRALVSVAARSLSDLDDDVTLPQFRALVLMATNGPQTVGALATDLTIHPSTATRLCDRLHRKGLVARAPSPENRRVVMVTLTQPGARLVDAALTRRRDEITAIVAPLTPAQRRVVARGLEAFAAASGERPDAAWKFGW